ncbi:MAG: DNA internalization-related competence protein ComEC/Rec2, partial [Planctomycetota bacterium]
GALAEQIFARSPLALLAVGFIGGIVIQHFFGPAIGWPLAILGLCTITIAVFLFLQNHSARLHVIACTAGVAFACLGAIRLAGFGQPAANDIRNVVGKERTLATIRGYVSTEPSLEDRDSWKFGRYLWSEPGTSFYLKLGEVKTKTGWAKVGGNVRVQVAGKATDIKIGDYIEAYCWLDGFGEPLNPGQFNLKKYLSQRGVFVGASVKSRGGIELLARGGPTFLSRVKNRLKKVAAEALFGETSPDDESNAMLNALLLGQRGGLGPAVFDAFCETGLAHFICLSGLHIGILAGFVWWVCRATGLTKRPRAIVCIIVIALYVMIVPPRAPTLRAAIICWFFCLSVLVRRRPNALNTLSLSAIVLLALRPMDLFNVGWQLSYTSVLGIILLQRHISNWLFERTIDKISVLEPKENERLLVRFCKPVPAWAVELLSVGVAAWLGGAGVLLYHFGAVTPMAAVWTVLVFPLVFAILAVGFVKMVLAALLPTAALLLGMIATGLADFLIWIVKFIAGWNISGAFIGTVSVWLIVLYYSFLFFWRFGYLQKPVLKRVICAVMAIMILISLGHTKYRSNYRRDLELVCLAVGHGQAVFVGMPGGENVLFDAGSLSTKDCGRRVVIPFLREKGISRLDAIFLSHDDIDHMNGVPEIVSNLGVKGIYANAAFVAKADTWSTAGYLADCLRNENQQLKLLDEYVSSDGRAKIIPLWPEPAVCRDESVSDNDKSQVILIEFAGKAMLLCSDIERFAQERILQRYRDLKADVVIMPHHGSTRNLTNGFVETIGAKAVLISCSKTRYEAAYKSTSDTKVFYTPVDGAVTVKITPGGAVITTGFVRQL